MHSKQINIIIIFIALLLNACDKQQIDFEDIDIKIDSSYNIVIDGFITNELTIHRVRLSKPVYSMDTIIFTPINNAYVYLTNNSKKYIYKLSDKQGVYQSIDSIKGKVNKEYTINVLYDDILYTASDILQPVDTVIDFPVHEMKQYDNFVEIYCLRYNFGYNIPSIWNFNESTDSLGNIIYFDAFDFYNVKLYNCVGSIPQGLFPTHWEGTGPSGNFTDSLELIKMSVSDKYYKYLISMFNITDWSSGMFSTIQGNTLTNINNGGTGFFYCTEIKRYRMTYKDLINSLNE